MDKTTERFASYAASLAYADLTAEAIHAVKRSVVDSIGCAFGAFSAEPTTGIRRLASQITSKKPASVIGTRIQTSAEMAAFANGCMIRYLDFSDDYFGSGSKSSGPHPSDNIGAILAAAEANNLTGQQAVLGIALAYEVCGALVERTSLRERKWDYPIMHAIATSQAAGRIMGLSKEQLGNALAMAIVPNICTRQSRLGELSNWKSFAGPNGARNGLFAAMLAKGGITGPGEPFEGKAGFFKQLNESFTLGDFGGRGVPFKIQGTYFKYIPVRYTIQLPVTIALELRERAKHDQVKSLTVFLEEHSVFGGSYNAEAYDPKTRESADHSGAYLIAAALVDGEITEKTFTPERFRDLTIHAAMKKIRAEEDKAYTATWPKEFNCRFEATLNSGEVIKIHRTNPKGHPANPVSDQEIEAKFLRQVDPYLPREQSRRLLDALWQLEKAKDISQLMALTAIPGK